MNDKRILYVAINEKGKIFGCRSQKLIERFIAKLPLPSNIIIVRVTTPKGGKIGYLGTSIINTPNINTSKVNETVTQTIGSLFRTQVPTNQLGIPILTKENFEHFESGFGKQASA